MFLRFNRSVLEKPFPYRCRISSLQNNCDFVKIILLKNATCALALRKRLFCDAKPTLLPCKTAAFEMQNNRFCNVLIKNELGERHVYEKYLHLSELFLLYIIRCLSRVG